MVKAYSYIRFSRPEQMKGNSLQRQLKKSEAYCTENNLTLDTTLNLKDLGVSAFRGKHLDEHAALGGFIKAIEDGKVSKGSYLLIESLDRLSRQKIMDAFDLFKSIIGQGIIIITLSDNTVYDSESINDFAKVIVSLAIMSRAHEESKIKSERVQAAIIKKRDNTENKKITSICPAWLYLNKDKTKFIQIDENVETVKLIFKLSAKGMGIRLIIAHLISHNIPPIGKSKTKGGIAKWHPAYIQNILSDGKVIGRYTSNSSFDGQRIYENYYPQVISDELYYSVQKSRKSRLVNGGGRKGKFITNLFSKICYCGYSVPDYKRRKCNGSNEVMVHVNKHPRKYLQCGAAKAGRCTCKEFTKMWRYDEFEYWMLLHISEIDASILFPDKETEDVITNLKTNVTTITGKLDEVKRRIQMINNTMFEGLFESIPASILQQLTKLEGEQTELSTELDNTKTLLTIEKSIESTPKQNAKKLKELINHMAQLEGEELYDLRLRLSVLLKETIEQIDVFTSEKNKWGRKYRMARINFKSGAVRFIRQTTKKRNNNLYDSITMEQFQRIFQHNK
jgi:DNA invertase Pin-like site-specific DNA recombinase